jgi:hypothetical protein
LREHVREISLSPNRLEAFQRFSALESQFEPIEADVHELAAEVDHMIQIEIDRMRGK